MFKKSSKIRNGFTIIELMVTVALLAVMLAVGIPGFANLFQVNNIAEISNRFVSSMMLARSEAISENTTVIMCQVNGAGTACDNDGQWEDGWTVWIDLDGDNVIDNNEHIARENPLPANYTLRSVNNSFANSITFSPTGDASGDVASAADILRLCEPDRNSDLARLIFINAVGRAWVNRTPGFDDTVIAACPT